MTNTSNVFSLVLASHNQTIACFTKQMFNFNYY